MSVWIEAGSSKFDHGGKGWEFGTCIWSPSLDRRGVQGRYGIMLQVHEGDVVINCCDSLIRGTSYASECVRRNDKPPDVGPWAYAKGFFRVDLKDFKAISCDMTLTEIAKTHKEKIRKDIEENRPMYYLFSWHPVSAFHPEGKLVLSQGRFLAKATPLLASILASYLDDEARNRIERQLQSGSTASSKDA
jgi:hypothetical protein